MERNWDVIIIGGGPAGLASSIYCGRALRRTLVLEKKVFGGQIVFSDTIENYPGFAEPIVPSDLMEQMGRQAERYVAVLENDEALGLKRDGREWEVAVYQNAYRAKAIIYAAGSAHRFLGVPGEKELLGRGVSVCATCDAPFFQNKRVAVLGGGDTALYEALHLAKFAAEVVLVHRRDQFRAEKILQDRVLKNNRIRVSWDSEVTRFHGVQKLEGLDVRNKKTGASETVPFDGAFLAIGTIPSTELLRGLVKLDENGYVLTDFTLCTEAPGLFVSGEVIKGNRRQVAISVGMGVQAALSCEEYLSSLE